MWDSRITMATKLKFPTKRNRSSVLYYSSDMKPPEASEIWKKDESIRKKTLFVARKKVIELFKELGRFPKQGKIAMIPHPTIEGQYISEKAFSKADEVINEDYLKEERQTWEDSKTECRIIYVNGKK